MRFAITVIIVFCLLFQFTACAILPDTDNSATSDSLGTNPSAPNIENTEIVQKPMYSIALQPVTESKADANGSVIFRHHFQNISLILPEPEVADKIILDYLNRNDATSRHAESALLTAEQAYSNTKDDWDPHLLQMHYEPMRFDSGVLSLFGEVVSYTGGGHSAITGESVTYDLLTGNPLKFADVLNDAVSLDSVIDLVNNALESMRTEEQLFPGYNEIVAQLLGGNIQQISNWYLSDQGLVFYFDPYEIAPYVSGTVFAEIPYDKLNGILNSAYFPAEQAVSVGRLNAVAFSDTELTDYTQFSEIILCENGIKALLFATGAVSNIRISTVDDHGLTDELPKNTILFGAYTLTAGDAIMVEANLDNTPLAVTYTANGQKQTCLLSFKEDSVVLE